MTRHPMVPEWLDPAEWDDTEDATGTGAPTLAELAAADPAGRTTLVEEYLRHEVAGILRTDPERVDPASPLGVIGIGSMKGVELQRRVRGAIGVDLDLGTVLGSLSIAGLAAHTAESVAGLITSSAVRG
ncbi:acyl carrier protein [Streptomyces sp. WELS2]|uniref:acyl carrier protein n=1 Tax=Streptomyces sp. WELS2 TaxID=2749435 RepID=UPI0015F052E9|nr:acyl carrier protein [Streptomyces sp. WELS2]